MSIDRLVRERERRQLTGIPTSTWYELIDRGLAPPGVRLGKQSVAWPESELATLNAARIAARSDDEIRKIVHRMVDARIRALENRAA